jgi:hypothetical protein
VTKGAETIPDELFCSTAPCSALPRCCSLGTFGFNVVPAAFTGPADGSNWFAMRGKLTATKLAKHFLLSYRPLPDEWDMNPRPRAFARALPCSSTGICRQVSAHLLARADQQELMRGSWKCTPIGIRSESARTSDNCL